jgi:uncharacterized Zn-binding protein involved in type VI secretion
MTDPINVVTHYLALQGDKTTTGSTIISGSTHTISVGNVPFPIARMTDRVSVCPVCGQEGVILEGDFNYTLDGVPAAYDGCHVRCGCPEGTVTLVPTPRLTTQLQFPVREVNMDVLEKWKIANMIAAPFSFFGFLADCGNIEVNKLLGDTEGEWFSAAGAIADVLSLGFAGLASGGIDAFEIADDAVEVTNFERDGTEVGLEENNKKNKDKK